MSQDEEKILCENIRGTIPMLRTLIEKGFVISQGDKIYQKLSLVKVPLYKKLYII